jgi:citrate lyase subunit beta/citryl-CoA lyase
MNPLRVRRSALYTPGVNLPVLLKAARSEADILIFDLEDAVAPESKLDARTNVLRALADASLAGRYVVVRVNGLGTPWGAEDVHTIAESRPKAILFPKINTPDDVQSAERAMTAADVVDGTELWCMIETPAAILNARDIASTGTQSTSRMTTLVLGTNDLAKELRGRHTAGRENLMPLLALTVLAARESGLCILDGVHNDVRNMGDFARACEQARDLGFDGKTLIHPTQVAECNRLFSPAAAEVLEAKAIVDAFALPENRGRGVLQVNGKMVELLHAQIAQTTIATAKAIGMAEAG